MATAASGVHPGPLGRSRTARAWRSWPSARRPPGGGASVGTSSPWRSTPSSPTISACTRWLIASQRRRPPNERPACRGTCADPGQLLDPGAGRRHRAASAASAVAELLILSVYEEVLRGRWPARADDDARRGGAPSSGPSTSRATSSSTSSIRPSPWGWVENVGRVHRVSADKLARARQADPAKQARAPRARKPLMERYMERSAAGDAALGVHPLADRGGAAGTGMSCALYEDIFYSACLREPGGPRPGMQGRSEGLKRLDDWIASRSRSTSRPPCTDLKLNVRAAPSSRRGRARDARRRVLHRPVEDTANGHISFSMPATQQRAQVAGARFAFKGGKVGTPPRTQGTRTTSSRSSYTDEGARCLGEPGIRQQLRHHQRQTRRSCSTRRSAARCTWRSGDIPETGGDERAMPSTGT